MTKTLTILQSIFLVGLLIAVCINFYYTNKNKLAEENYCNVTQFCEEELIPFEFLEECLKRNKECK